MMVLSSPIYGSEIQPAQSAPVPAEALRLGNQTVSFVMPGHSRQKDGVASAYVPGIHVLLNLKRENTWMAGTSSAKTRFTLLPGHDELG
jgi:hypothetical protein